MCPCGREFPARWENDEIQILCDRCARLHHRGDPKGAPAWQDWTRIPYTSESEIQR